VSLEPPEARERFRRIVQYCRWARASLRLNYAVPFEVREELARLWEEYISQLPPEVREREAIAMLGYPFVVPLKDVPRLIRQDPLFARRVIEVYGE